MDFACKNFRLEEVIRCSLGLTKGEYKILNFLIKSKETGLTSQKIAQNVELDISTTQRCLKKLAEKKIIIRSQKNLNNGGYIFSYSINNKSEIKNTIIKIIHNWTKKFEDEINGW